MMQQALSVFLYFSVTVYAMAAAKSCCVDKDFIRQQEGFSTKGYVPQEHGKPLDKSGVTIGNGIDLGSKNRKYFEDLGVNQRVIAKLQPYFGLKGEAAIEKLKEQPLNLTQQEAKGLSDRVMQKQIVDVGQMYNQASAKVTWCQLTTSPRTVISSVLFQYGSPARVPTFWRLVTHQNWSGTIQELRNFKDKYTTRRHKEADYLEQDKGARLGCD